MYFYRKLGTEKQLRIFMFCFFPLILLCWVLFSFFHQSFPTRDCPTRFGLELGLCAKFEGF